MKNVLSTNPRPLIGLLLFLFITMGASAQWTTQTSGTTSSLRGVFFVNATTGWAVGANGTVRKTVNAGSTWTNQSTTTTQWNSVYFNSPTIGWIAGNGGAVRKTTDGGTTWSAQTSNTTQNINSVFFFNVNTGWAAANNGDLQKTTDGGGHERLRMLRRRMESSHRTFNLSGW